MVVVEAIYFDSDDYDVRSEVILCDTNETAKALVKKTYEKILEDYEFDDEADRKNWESRNVKWKENGGVYVCGGDAGYALITIADKEPITSNGLVDFEVKTYNFY